MESNFPREKGLFARIDQRPRFPCPEIPNYSKIIFLNKENLAEFEGYKATVEMHSDLFSKCEVHVILTGFSWQGAKALFSRLVALPADEITEK